MNDYTACSRALPELFADPAIRERAFYPDFRRGWDALFQKALQSEVRYFEEDGPGAIAVPCSWDGPDFLFHLDQNKMADWYDREVRSRRRVVFEPKRFRRDRAGKLSFHESPCRYDPTLPESTLGEKDRNIMAAAFPGIPPELAIVYGNKWVERTIGPLRRSSVALFLIRTPFVPAFLATPFEICLYLFLMDCCIIREDTAKVKDEDLRPLLHLFQPNPILKIKGFL